MKTRINDNTKQIVKAMLKDSGPRNRRKLNGGLTAFDLETIEAVETAKRQLNVRGAEPAIRDEVVEKIVESLEKGIPWEALGETYMGRRQFYTLRGEFIYLIARNMGMVDAVKVKRITKRDLKQYIAQLTELDTLTDQIGRMEGNGRDADRRKALRESVKESTQAVEAFVSSIRDSETRQMIMLRYMDPHGRMSWQQVANRMNKAGGRYTADYCRIKVDRYLSK